MAMDDLPRPANPTIDLRGIPASQDTFRTRLRLSVAVRRNEFEQRRPEIVAKIAAGAAHHDASLQ